jgi:hypothetical protein
MFEATKMTKTLYASGKAVRTLLLAVATFHIISVSTPNLQPLVDGLSVVVVSNITNDDTERVTVPESVVLFPGEYLNPGQYRNSPGTKFRAGLSNFGDFIVQDLQIIPDGSPLLIWSAGVTEGARLSMQKDGNLVLRDANGKGVWDTNTQGNPTARLVVDDGGQLALKDDSTRLWLGGLPRDFYNFSRPNDMQFPIRGTFYYAWYPETFTVDGHQAHYKPSLGWYSSSNLDVARNHIDALVYAHFELSISSWWGADTHRDRARLTMLMDETLAKNSTLRWTVYYEKEMKLNPTVVEIQNDLSYLMRWFARHPVWAYKDGKPIIFVYNENSNCEVARRWVQASNNEWFVVLKVFEDHDECDVQPDSFHQYGSGDDGVLHNKGYSFVVSPGFWHATENGARIPRISPREFCQRVNDMTTSGEPWQLVISFNEAGEGTMIESSTNWQSRSGYGKYLDCLHGVPVAAATHPWPGIHFSVALWVAVSFVVVHVF